MWIIFATNPSDPTPFNVLAILCGENTCVLCVRVLGVDGAVSAHVLEIDVSSAAARSVVDRLCAGVACCVVDTRDTRVRFSERRFWAAEGTAIKPMIKTTQM